MTARHSGYRFKPATADRQGGAPSCCRPRSSWCLLESRSLDVRIVGSGRSFSSAGTVGYSCSFQGIGFCHAAKGVEFLWYGRRGRHVSMALFPGLVRRLEGGAKGHDKAVLILGAYHTGGDVVFGCRKFFSLGVRLVLPIGCNGLGVI